MKDRSIYVIIAVVIVGVIAISTGLKEVPSDNNPWYAIHIGDERSAETTSSTPASHRSIDASGAQSAQITLEQAVGEMRIDSTGEYLMDATFDARPSSWIPAVDYSLEGTRGVLLVRQPEAPGPLHDGRNVWHVSLTDTLPVDLAIKRGVGQGTIDLHDVDVTSLNAQLGVGETTIDLSGERTHDVSVRIESGVGKCTLLVPQNMAVRLTAEKGIGSLTVQGFESKAGVYTRNSDVAGVPVMTVNIEQGIGDIQVRAEP